MKGILNLFKKPQGFRPQVGQPIELELVEAGQPETVLYAIIRQVEKKMLVIEGNGSDSIAPGTKVRVCALAQPWFHSYQAKVFARDGQRLEISLPGNDTDNKPVPTFEEEHKIDFATPADYQASRSPYKQAAEVLAVGRKGLTLSTNMSIPSQTSLEISMRLPQLKQPLSAQVKAVKSQSLEGKKFATEVEFVEFSESDREKLWELALRQHLRQTTRSNSD